MNDTTAHVPSVLFGCPLHHGESGMFRAGYGDLLVKRLPGWEFSWYEVGGCGITKARDVIAAKAVKENYDVLAFVASDIGFNADQCARMLAHFARDPALMIVGGCYLLKRFPLRLCLNSLGPEYRADANGLLEVKETGTDFLFIRVDALRRFIEAHPESQYDDYEDDPTKDRGIAWNIFNQGVVQDGPRRRFLTEDFWWCWHARQMGIKVHVDTKVMLKHDGRFVYDANDLLRTAQAPAPKLVGHITAR